MRLFPSLVGAVLFATAAVAQNVQLVPYERLAEELRATVDFEDMARVPSPGQVVDGIAEFEGASFAERFQGQIVLQQGGFDVLDFEPVGPLALVPGKPGQNLGVEFLYYLTNQMKGMAPPGFPEIDAGGEGAVAILFDRDQSALGFRVTSEPIPKDPNTPRGRMSVDFYRRDGSLIDRLDVVLEWNRAGYGFERVGGIEDIAGIAITNRDPQGVAIDDVIFDRDLVVGWLR